MSELKIQFFDVGQGDGIFIQFPGGATMLVDLGSTKNKTLTSTDVAAYFRDHTKFGTPGETLDYLILTHGDRDHYNMVKAFITDLKVQVGRIMFGGLEDDYKGLIGEIKKLCPNVERVVPNGLFPFQMHDTKFGRAEVHVLAAGTRATSKNDEGWRKNTASIVLRLVYGRASVILAGDATADTEKFILSTHTLFKSNLLSHVLKVGHHGSRRTSNTVPWIKAVGPLFVFISSDRHGALDEDTATGHRLPQTLTLDLIARHSGRLFDKCVSHNAISAFDPFDYSAYNAKPDLPKDNLPVNGNQGEWRKTLTPLGIFTSLVDLDSTQADNSEADQGDQYQLSIDDQGEINITSTLGSGHWASVRL